jgi:predicted small lipoprotein YifL
MPARSFACDARTQLYWTGFHRGVPQINPGLHVLITRLTASNGLSAHLVPAALLLCCLLIAGCGQKGDLYLPDGEPAEELQEEQP